MTGITVPHSTCTGAASVILFVNVTSQVVLMTVSMSFIVYMLFSPMWYHLHTIGDFSCFNGKLRQNEVKKRAKGPTLVLGPWLGRRKCMKEKREK